VPDKSVYSPANIGISIVGGLAAAVVFAVLGKGSMSGFLLAQLAPLPLMIVALGLGVGHGATAALAGTLLLSFWPHWLFGLAFGLVVALPAWLSCFAIAGAPYAGRDRLTRGLPGWAVLVQCLAVSGAAVFFLGVGHFSDGRMEEPLGYVRQQFNLAIEAMKEQHLLEEANKPEELKRFAEIALPATLASHIAMMQAIDLWIAARLTQISGMLKLPWPDIAAEFVLPRPVAALFVVCAVLAGLKGVGGSAALAIAAPLGLAYAFQGLAVTHFWLRGSRSSLIVLTIIYFFLGLLGAPILIFTLLGLADVFFRFRERKTASPKPDEAA
jgi:hypothetical protein